MTTTKPARPVRALLAVAALCVGAPAALAGWFEKATGIRTPEPIRKIAPNGIQVFRHGTGDGSHLPVEPDATPYHYIRSASFNVVLHVRDGDKDVVVSEPKWQANNVWRLIPVGGGQYVIQCAHHGRVLDAASNGNVLSWDRHNGSNQRWREVPAGNGAYYLECVQNGKVLDIAANGDVIVRPRDGSRSQKWLPGN